MRLPDSERSRVVVIGASTYDPGSGLAELPLVANNCKALAAVLTDPVTGGFAAQHCQVVLDPESVIECGRAIDVAVSSARDVLLIYYAGHGLIDHDSRLYLSVKTSFSDPRLLGYSSIDYNVLRTHLRNSNARVKILLLDCCFSGRAVATLAAEQKSVGAMTDVQGAYVLTSTTATEAAGAVGDAGYTAFTGDLLHLLINGLAGGPEFLTLPSLYDRLVDAATARGRPRPQQIQTNSAHDLAVVRNRHDVGPMTEVWFDGAAAGPSDDGVDSDPAPWWERGFRLGPLKTSMVVVEGDGQQPIREENINVRLEHRDSRLPPEIAQWRDEVSAEQEAKKEAGRQFRWNGLNYALSSFVVSRLGVDERPAIDLSLQNSDYYTFMATQQLDRPMADGTTPREKYLHVADVWSIPAFMCCSFGLNIALVTADDQLVYVRRSAVVDNPGLWSSSANEALSRTLDSLGRSSPNLYQVARRGVAEELSVEPHEYELEMLAFHIDANTCQWGASLVAFCRQLTADELAQRISRGAPDKWEHDEIDFSPFAPEAVLRYLLREDRIGRWSAAAPALYYMSLIRRYGKPRVERAVATVLAEMPRKG